MQSVKNSTAIEEMEVMRLWSVTEVARFLGVSVRTTRRYYQQSDLPYVDLPGKIIRFRQEAVNAWARAHERKH